MKIYVSFNVLTLNNVRIYQFKWEWNVLVLLVTNYIESLASGGVPPSLSLSLSTAVLSNYSLPTSEANVQRQLEKLAAEMAVVNKVAVHIPGKVGRLN